MAGNVVREVELSAEVFDVKPNASLVHGVVVALQANKRQGTHATKTRAFVSGSGKKPFRQKGTGNARQGSNRSPLMRGGAVVHGANPRSYRQKFPKKAKNLALRVALSERMRRGNLVVVDTLTVEEYKTKQVVALLGALGVQKVLIADVREDDYLYRSARNIYRTDVVAAREMSVLDVVSHDSLVMSEEGVRAIEGRLLRKSS